MFELSFSTTGQEAPRPITVMTRLPQGAPTLLALHAPAPALPLQAPEMSSGLREASLKRTA
ncbi:hypothetical protein CVO96_17075 [Deinococcus koreensis]|uniref:Uncharacterized protein n=1 Tax=Deinococcus koreensis TaxID=2054903 RepID=A0A2K3UT12_9DEIO|nr:hypothetical protein CVO96_17075 [Deinococcus koreensis]